jgi:hypothetical protein
MIEKIREINREDIIKLAQKAGPRILTLTEIEYLERFAALVLAAKEKEQREQN